MRPKFTTRWAMVKCRSCGEFFATEEDIVCPACQFVATQESIFQFEREMTEDDNG